MLQNLLVISTVDQFGKYVIFSLLKLTYHAIKLISHIIGLFVD